MEGVNRIIFRCCAVNINKKGHVVLGYESFFCYMTEAAMLQSGTASHRRLYSLGNNNKCSLLRLTVKKLLDMWRHDMEDGSHLDAWA